MYRWVLREHNRLCPGTCWATDKDTQKGAHKREI